MVRLLLFVALLISAAADRSLVSVDGGPDNVDKPSGDLAKIQVPNGTVVNGPVANEVAEVKEAKQDEKEANNHTEVLGGDLAKVNEPKPSGDLTKVMVEPGKVTGKGAAEIKEVEAAKDAAGVKEDPAAVTDSASSKPVAPIKDGNTQVASVAGELPSELRYDALSSLARSFAATAEEYSSGVSTLEGNSNSAIDKSRTYASHMKTMKTGLESFSTGVKEFRSAVKHNHTAEVAKVRKELSSSKDKLPA